MRVNEMLLIAMTCVYTGLVLGVVIRFVEEKKYCIIPFAVAIPIMVLCVNIKYCIEIFRRKKKLTNKIKHTLSTMYIVTRYFNILLQFNAQVFIESKLDEGIKKMFTSDYELNGKLTTVYSANENFLRKELRAG